MGKIKWTVTNLINTLNELRARGGETPNIEVKSAHKGYPLNIAQTLCAFCNLPDGGTLICGVDENAGFEPVGVYNIAQLEKSLIDTMRNALEPEASADFTLRPCTINGKAYLRHGDGDYLASDYEVSRLVAGREKQPHDTEPVEGSVAQDLSPLLVEGFVAEAQAFSRKHLAHQPVDVVLQRKRVLDIGGDSVTVAGLYALGQYPQQFFPSLKISGVVEDSTGQARNLDKFEADGALPEMLVDAVAWVQRNLRKTVIERGDGHLVDSYDVPLLVVRELIANALVHRELSPLALRGQDVHIRISEKKIVITNPGGLWGVNLQNLPRPGYKSAVNDVLYEICKLLKTADGARVIEGEGSGIFEAQRAMAEAGLPQILFANTGLQFTAIVSREKRNQPQRVLQGLADENQREVFAVLVEVEGRLDVLELVDRTGLTERQVRYALDELLERELVSRRRRKGARAFEYAAF
ncbi:MAG: ATP-binding protein [Microbacteriaceae bacterium]|nr:ATP-binding protein [Microbacteriaceae bacterium]